MQKLLFMFIIFMVSGTACAVSTPSVAQLPPTSTEAETLPTSTVTPSPPPLPISPTPTQGAFPLPENSPSGKILVFKTETGISMMNPDGSDQEPLLNPPVGLATLSSDVQKVAYEFQSGIHILDLQANQGTLLYAPGLFPHWSPDSQQIGFECNDKADWRICVINVDGTNLRKYGEWNEHQRVSFNDWSSDGNQIVFTLFAFPPGGGRGRGTIQRLDLSTGEIITLLDETALENIAWIANPALSPDGTHLLFSGKQTEIYSIFSMKLQTNEIQLIENETYDLTNPVWSPDGQFFIAHARTPLLFTITGEILYALNIPGGLVTSWVALKP
jgi:dipeptidyl aminopeptidase/acylaminoacyl peptidase